MQPLRGAAGRRAWPYHYHLANEEAIYVLYDSGTLRIGKREVAVLRGDYVALPVGEPGAHLIANTLDEPFRYLYFSIGRTRLMVYPDSDKINLFAGSAPGGPKEKRTFSKFLRGDAGGSAASLRPAGGSDRVGD